MILATIESLIGHWVTLVKAHEKLLITAAIVFVLIHYGDKAYDAYGKHLAAITKTDTTIIKQDDTQTKTLADTLSKALADMTTRMQKDEALIAQAKTTVIVQQQKNNAMPPPELYAHWADDINLPLSNITAAQDGSALVSLDAAHATVNQLDEIPSLTAQLTARTDELTSCTTVQNDQAASITQLNKDVADGKKTLADTQKQAAHDKRAAWLNGFKWGGIVGFVGGIIVFHHATPPSTTVVNNVPKG